MRDILFGLKQDKEFGGLNESILVTCAKNELGSGGVFLLNFNDNSMNKVFEGDCRGISIHGANYIIATGYEGILVLDRKFQLVTKSEALPLDIHGITKLNDDILLVVETGSNSIGCYSIKTFRRIGEIRINQTKKDENHLNDIWMEGKLLYLSMFTPSGDWHKDLQIKAGCIAAFDLTKFNPYTSTNVSPANHLVKKGLYMPHSVLISKGKLMYCNSMSFEVVTADKNIPFQGFTRGLAVGDDFIFVGQSRMRHFSRISDHYMNCMIETGVYIYKQSKRISRFIPLPVGQVYQILLMKN